MVGMNTTKFLRLFLCSLLTLGCSALWAADDPPLRAGAATSNITPPLGATIIGGFHPFPATHVHDELLARTLVLDDGDTKLAIVICDLLGISRGISIEARRMIETECGIPPSHVLIAGTHTHSGPNALGEDRFAWDGGELNDYQQFVARRVADGVRRALNQLEPAELAWGYGEEPDHVFNRRWFMEPTAIGLSPLGDQDRVKMNPPRGSNQLIKPAGPTDPQVWFLAARSLKGRPIALLANYSLHYVGGVGNGHISADYFGVFAEEITYMLQANRQDPPFVAMLSNGTSGDINNINFRQATERREPYEKIRIVAHDVAEAVHGALANVTWHRSLKLAADYREPMIASRKVSPQQLERARAIVADLPKAPERKTLEQIYAERTIAMDQWPDEVPVPVQVLKIGDLAIGTMPCEIFVEIGLELKSRSPMPAYFTIELAHGYYGYLPTPEQHELGGYETWLGTNRLEFTASRKLTSELLDMMKSLKDAEGR